MTLYLIRGLVICHLHTFHIDERGWLWMIYLRGRRMIMAYLRHSNQVTGTTLNTSMRMSNIRTRDVTGIKANPVSTWHPFDTSQAQWIDTSSVHSRVRTPAALTVTRSLCLPAEYKVDGDLWLELRPESLSCWQDFPQSLQAGNRNCALKWAMFWIKLHVESITTCT